MMESPENKENRQSPRRRLANLTKIRTAPDAPLRDCLILDMSHEGVRLYIGGLNIPDQFVLLVGDDVVAECTYQVIWRRDREIGAKLVQPLLADG
jgi:PilZ domain